MTVNQTRTPQGIDAEPRPIENYDTHYTAKFEIDKEGVKGVLHVYNGGIEWEPDEGQEKNYNLYWASFARVMAENGWSR